MTTGVTEVASYWAFGAFLVGIVAAAGFVRTLTMAILVRPPTPTTGAGVLCVRSQSRGRSSPGNPSLASCAASATPAPTMSEISTKPPSGMRDFLAADVMRRRHVLAVVQRVYESFGFVPLETPTIENLSTLLGKYGPEGDQLLKEFAQRVLERPFLGWAMDGSRTIPGADDEVIVIRHNLGGVPVHEAQLPLHPHNAPLQWWLELGLGGLLAVVTLLGRLIVLASRHQGIAAGAMLAAIGSAFCISSVSYGFWQSWWQGGLWLTAAMLVSLFSCRPANQSNSKAFL